MNATKNAKKLTISLLLDASFLDQLVGTITITNDDGFDLSVAKRENLLLKLANFFKCTLVMGEEIIEENKMVLNIMEKTEE